MEIINLRAVLKEVGNKVIPKVIIVARQSIIYLPLIKSRNMLGIFRRRMRNLKYKKGEIFMRENERGEHILVQVRLQSS